MEDQKREVMAAVAARIKHLRLMQSISQEELALRANINTAYYGQVERGLKCPTIDTLYKIALALEVPPADLLRTDTLPHYDADNIQRIKDILSHVLPNKIDQVFKILEDAVELL